MATSWSGAQRVFERRCVVCHGCYDAPCQLALSTFEGIARGASKVEVYDASRLLATTPTRLGVDAQGALAWRAKGFHPVLGEPGAGVPAQSLLLRMLELKQLTPLPASERLPDDLHIGLDRRHDCPRLDEFERFATQHPASGMPYALPGLSAEEHALLVRWISEGTPSDAEPPLTRELAAAVERWEWFLNQPSKKARLMARYLYEHLFLASLHFDEMGSSGFFRVMRARNAFGAPVEIATRRPFDDPGAWPFYYRIVPRHGVTLAKTHMPYALNEVRLSRYRELFLEPVYQVRELPPYEPRTAANPFAAFAALPVRSRYLFLLDEAHFAISSFIKGPVCRGQLALDVIHDRFWITFVDPSSPTIVQEDDLLARSSADLSLPAEQGSNGLLLNWRRYASRHHRFLRDKAAYLASFGRRPEFSDLEQVWDGDGKNDNAALTVFRHFDSATVVKGLLGGPPETAWVVSYSLLERIHYLLVAGFDVFGNVGHQLHTRLYMDFLRMEAEHNFLLLLPKARRPELVNAWYRGAETRVKQQVYGKLASLDRETNVTYRTGTPERELYGYLQARIFSAAPSQHQLLPESDRSVDGALNQLLPLRGLPASLLPETSFLEVSGVGGDARYFTLLRESAHTNVAQLFGGQARRRPDEDGFTLLRGFVGAYPNALFRVEQRHLERFVDSVRALDGEPAYAVLRSRYGVRRTNPRFWEYGDRFQDAYRRLEPLDSGLLDYSRLEDR